MTASRLSSKAGNHAASSSTQLCTTSRITKRPSQQQPSSSVDNAIVTSRPMLARMMGGNRLVSPAIMGGRLTSGDRLWLSNQMLKNENKARDSVYHRRRNPAGLGVLALEKFANESERIRTGIRGDDVRGDLDNGERRPFARSRAGPAARKRRSTVPDANGFVETSPRSRARYAKELVIASKYNAISTDATSPSPSRTKKRTSETRHHHSPKRRKEKENVASDVIVVSDSSDDDRQNSTRMKKKAKSQSKPKPKHKSQSRSKPSRRAVLVPLAASDPAFDPQVGGSPPRSSAPGQRAKPKASHHSSTPSRHSVTKICRSSSLGPLPSPTDSEQVDPSVETVAASDREPELSSPRSPGSDKEPVASDSHSPIAHKGKPGRSVVNLVSPKRQITRNKRDTGHGRTSPLTSSKNGTLQNNSSPAAKRRLVHARKRSDGAIQPHPAAPNLAPRFASSDLECEDTTQTRSICISFSPIRAYPDDLSGLPSGVQEVVEVSDHSDRQERAVRSAAKHGKGSKNRDEEIPPTTFYGKTRAQTRRLSSRSNYGSTKPETRRRKTKKPVRSSSDKGMDSSGDIRLRPLSTTELKQVKSVTMAPNSQVVARIEEANIELKALINARNSRHFIRHESLDSTSDVVSLTTRLSISASGDSSNASPEPPVAGQVNVKTKSKKVLQLFERPRPRVHIFNSFFFTRLTQGDGYDYQGVRRWLRRAGKSVAELDLIMFPININNMHWVLAAIDLRGKMFLYFDSTYGEDTLDSVGLLRRWLVDEVLDKCGEEKLRGMNVDSWSADIIPDYTPHQTDYGSCGVFALYTAEYLERGARPVFQQKHVRTLRRRTALFLKDGSLPEE